MAKKKIKRKAIKRNPSTKKKKENLAGMLIGAGILGIGAYLLLRKGKGKIRVKNIDPTTITITLLNGKKEIVEEPTVFTSTIEKPFLDFEVSPDAYFIKAEAVGYVTQEFGPIKIEKAGITKELEIDLIQEGEGTLLTGNFVIFDANKTTEDLISDVKLFIDGNQYPIQDQTYNGEQVVLTQGTHNINVEKEGYTLPGGAQDVDFQTTGFIVTIGMVVEGQEPPGGAPNGTIIQENVLYNLHSEDEIQIQVPVKNTGTLKGEYRVLLLDENQQEIFEVGLDPIEGSFGGPYETFLGQVQKYTWKTINPNETKWIIIDTGDSMFIDQPNEVGNQFYLKLTEKTVGDKAIYGPFLITTQEGECSPEGTNLFLMEPSVSAQQVFPTSIVSFELEVVNNGNVASDVKIELSRNGSFRKQLTTFLSQGQKKTINFVDGMFEWNTAYNYTAEAFIVTDDNQEIPCGNVLNFPAILSGQPAGETCTPAGVSAKIVDLNYFPSEPEDGNTVSIEATVENVGSITGDLVVEIYDETIPDSQPIHSYSFPNILPATGMSIVPYTFIVEAGKEYEFTYLAYAIDPNTGDYTLCESPVSTGKITVEGEPTCVFPISASVDDFNPNSPEAGELVDIEYSVDNNFTIGCSTNILVKVRVNGSIICEENFSNVNSGQTISGSCSFTPNNSGSYTIQVTAITQEGGLQWIDTDTDILNVSDEPCDPNLEVTEMYLVTNNPSVGSNIWFRWKLCNSANCSTDYSYEVWLDNDKQFEFGPKIIGANYCSPTSQNLNSVVASTSGNHTIKLKIFIDGVLQDQGTLGVFVQ